ncbi:glycosyltransferase [Blastococcus deserti]|uniref:Glycosyltransferase n=1 Tax=Blastococcus deserti TaxID=2259033 RepID=A0ABW4X8A0_9ACTN
MDRLTDAGVTATSSLAPGRHTSAPSRRLRILHVSETYGGGVETLVRQFTAQQISRGHSVHLLAPPGMASVQGVERSTWEPRRSRPTSVVPAVRTLRRTVRLHQPDVVHLHSFVAGLLGRLPVPAPLRLDVPVLYQPHAWSFQVFGMRSAATAMRAWERRASSRTDVLLTNCSDEVEEGRRSGITTAARVLGVAVDLERFRPASEALRERARRDLGLTARHVLLCMGRLAHQKGQDLLVAAWEQRRPPDTVLVLLGPGDPAPLRALAPTQWGRSLVAAGGQDDVRPWLWATDVLLLPSRYETIGLCVAEAMACGVPVVATDVNGVRETVVAGPARPAGAVVPVRDMDALLDEAKTRLEDPLLRRTEGMNGRARAEELFRPERLADRLEDAYRDAVRAHRERTGERETTS